MKKSLFMSFMYSGLCLSGCTYSINMIHSEGTSSDLIDETDTPSTVISLPSPTVSNP